MPRRALIAGVVAAAVAAAAIALVVDGDEPRPPSAPPAAPPAELDEPAAGPSLAVGITEPNPNFVWAGRAVPAPFDRWRDELGRMRPAVYRLVVDWSAVQPDPGSAPDLDAAASGCMRFAPPCAAYGGVRDQLRALASRQRTGGWQALVVITGTPAWAQAPAAGCARGAGAQVPRPDALAAYGDLIAALLAAAAFEGAELRYFSPWNEPNHPRFLAPQRVDCDPASPSLAIAPYVDLARALQVELAAHPGNQRLVLGETAGIPIPSARATGIAELLAGLPRDLVCAAPVWAQHAYVGGDDPVATAAAALDAHRCARRHAIWITETGVGPVPDELAFARGISGDREGCQRLHERLAAWYADPRVTLAAQYTLREDDQFPTGLVSTDLLGGRPALAEWQAWGARRDAADPAPAPAC